MTWQNAHLIERALAHQRRGEIAAADAIYRHVLEVNPSNTDALHYAGLIAHHGKDYARALDLLTRAVGLRPDFADAYYGRGLTRLEMGERDAAADDFQHAITQDPRHARAHMRLGLLMLDRNDLENAARSLEQATAAEPDSATAAVNLGIVRQRQGRLDDAVRHYERAIEIEPGLEIAHNNLAVALQELGRAEDALAIWHRIESELADPVLAANFLTGLNLVPGTLGEFDAAARRWAARFAEPLTHASPRPSADPDRRLRIGYIAADGLRRHTLAMTYMPLFEAHDRTQVDVIVYSDLSPAQADDITRRSMAGASLWQSVGGLSHEALAAQIRSDRIDVLVDGIGFAAGSRLQAVARRPAPIQVHFPPMSTTGMSAIDYVIGDERLVPRSNEPFFIEKIWRLDCGFLYHPLIDLPPLAPPPAIRNGYITFGSFNRIAKIGRTAVATWARVLQAVAGSRLIIKSSVGLSPDAIIRYQAAFREHGISAERIEFRGRVAGDVDHFRQFNDIDVALDTLPFCGVLTTCAASAMGVPVVTSAGTRILERYGTAILGAIGFNEGVATDVDDYVAKAIALASDPAQLAVLRPALRDQLLASPLCDAPAFAHSLESAYRAMWQHWCKSIGCA